MRSQNQLVIANGGSGKFHSQLFVGPKLVNRLEEISPGLDLTVDYGVLTFLSKPLYWLLAWYQSYVGNWGLAIILLTLTIKAAFYKLSETSYRSMAKMRKVSPRLKTLKGTVRQRPAKNEPGNDEALQGRKDQSDGGLSCRSWCRSRCLSRSTGHCWKASNCARPRFSCGSRICRSRDPYFVLPILMGISMVIQQRLNPPPRPDPGQDHDGFALRVHLFLRLLPGRAGTLLGGQQRVVDRAAVRHHQAHRGRGNQVRAGPGPCE